MASRAYKFATAARASFDERRIERQIVGVTRITVRRRGAKPQDARLHDISIYGCRLITGDAHRPGDRLWLKFAFSAPVMATVVWCDGASAGCRFEQPVPGSLVRSLILAQD